jgi:hypothetical protein
MTYRNSRRLALAPVAVVGLLIAAPGLIQAQGRGGRGPAPTGKSQAPFDLSGYWVSQIVDEWRFRVSPIKGDILYMPLNGDARRIADAWDPAKDEATGNACKAYGAIGVMQRPGRLHFSWVDENTLRLEADAGNQTRLLHFGKAPEKMPPPSLQGYSEASWEGPGFGRGGRGFGGGAPAGPPKTGTLKIVTTDMTPGYVRKNGVPYSDKAVLTEYISFLTGQKDDTYISVTTFVDDPVYLTGPFIRTYDFKRVPDGSGWDPTPCWTR